MKKHSKLAFILVITGLLLLSVSFNPIIVSGTTFKSKTFTSGNGTGPKYYNEINLKSLVWIRGQTYYANQSFIMETNPALFVNVYLRITLRLDDEVIFYSNTTQGGISPPVISNTTGNPGYYNVSWDFTPDNSWPDAFFIDLSNSFDSPSKDASDTSPSTLATIEVKNQEDITTEYQTITTPESVTVTATIPQTITETITQIGTTQEIISTITSPITTTAGLEMIMVISTLMVVVKLRMNRKGKN